MFASMPGRLRTSGPRALEVTMGRLLGIIVVVWLLIGVVAATQRGYFGDNDDVSCKDVGDTALTIVAGPLNYVGVNPKIDCNVDDVELPQPSE
jgi:hypothetical protein